MGNILMYVLHNELIIDLKQWRGLGLDGNLSVKSRIGCRPGEE